MSFLDLRSFLSVLRRSNDVVEIDAPVDPVLEAAEIHRRVIAAGGPALVFRNITGADVPLVTNLFGTARRAELAFGERPLQLIRRLVHLVETIMPPTPAKLWGARDVGLELLKVGLKRGSGGPVTSLLTSGQTVTHSRAFHVPGRGVLVFMDLTLPTVARKAAEPERKDPGAPSDDEWEEKRRRVRGGSEDVVFLHDKLLKTEEESEIDEKAIESMLPTPKPPWYFTNTVCSPLVAGKDTDCVAMVPQPAVGGSATVATGGLSRLSR